MENQTCTSKKIIKDALRYISIEEIGPSDGNVINYSLNEKKKIDMRRIEHLEGRFGGRCDVLIGHCSCGSTHRLNWLDNKLTINVDSFL